jgi:hypothetical protein
MWEEEEERKKGDGRSGMMGRVPVRGLGFSARPKCRGFVFLYSFSLLPFSQARFSEKKIEFG